MTLVSIATIWHVIFKGKVEKYSGTLILLSGNIIVI